MESGTLAASASSTAGAAAVVAVPPPLPVPVLSSPPQPAATRATARASPRRAPPRHLPAFIWCLLSRLPPLELHARYPFSRCSVASLRDDAAMKPPAFAYHRPATVPEALAVLADLGHDGKVLAG